MSNVGGGVVVNESFPVVGYFILSAVLSTVFSLDKHFIKIFGKEWVDQGRHFFSLQSISHLDKNNYYLHLLRVSGSLTGVNEDRRGNEGFNNIDRIASLTRLSDANYQMKFYALN